MLELQRCHLKIVREILAQYLPDYEIWAFGSRVTGRAKKYSDLDLVIIGKSEQRRRLPVPTLTIALVKEAFSESDLPFKVDIIDWAQTDDTFKDIIAQQHVVLQRGEESR